MAKEVNKSRKQEFRVRAPGAMSVQLVGDFTRWQKSPIYLRQGAGGM